MDVKKLEPLCTANRNVKYYSCYRKQYGVPQKIENRIATWSGNFTSGYIPQRIESKVFKRYLYTYVHSNILIIAKAWKQPKCPSTNEWVNKRWYINTMEHYFSLKKGRKFWHMPQHGWTLRNLEDITLSEISQSQKDKNCMIPLTWNT